MREKIKSYLVFTSFGYRLLMFALIPLAMIGCELMMATIFGAAGILIVLLLLLFVEIFADNWFLGGIQEKGAEKIDYLKSSAKGMKVMQNALILDLVRRFLAFVGVTVISYLLNQFLLGVENQSIDRIVFAVLISYGISVTGTLIARFVSLMWMNLIVAYFAATPALLSQIILIWVPAWIMNIVLGIFCVAMFVLAVKIAMWKVKGGYYDK